MPPAVSSPSPAQTAAPAGFGAVLRDATNHSPYRTPQRKAPAAERAAPSSAKQLLGSVKKKLKNWDDQMIDGVCSALGTAEKAQKYLSRQIERQAGTDDEMGIVTCQTVFNKPGPLGIEFRQSSSGNVEISSIDTAVQPVPCHWLVPGLELVAVQGHPVVGMGRAQVEDLVRTAGRKKLLHLHRTAACM
eukprot:SAG31_NODE_3300_length_4443_cov_3.762431_1_plen_189_part_00